MPDAALGDDAAAGLAEALRSRRGRARRRLVEQQDPERPGEAAGELDEPALAGGQRAGADGRRGRHVAELERLVGGRRASRASCAGERDRCAQRVRAPAWLPSAPSATFSRTVSESNSSIRWNVRPSPRRARAGGPDAGDVAAVET